MSRKLEVQYRPLGELIPYARNSRLHSDAQVAQLAGSIREWGFTNPVLIDEEGGIIAGHGRVLAARKLSMEQVPCIVLTGLSEAQKRAYVIADNKLALNASWDTEMLVAELASLTELGVDTELVGFGKDELEALFAQAGAAAATQVVEDEVPDPPKDPITKRGDLWLLGDHRVYCGDSAKQESWARVMDGDERADLVFTDPPYGVNYVGKTKDALEVHNDGASTLPALLAGAFDQMVLRCKPGAVWYVCAPPGPQLAVFGAALAERKLWRQSIAWVKDVLVLGHSDFHYQHEPIFYGWTEGAHRAPPDRKQTTVWQFDRPKRSEEHPTMKPVALVAHAIDLSSARGELVLDAFGGSGTTLVAAAQLGRRARLIEYGPEYVDVIVERWQNLTGLKAQRA